MGAVAALVGLLLGVAARPALAADAKLTMTVSQRWQLAATQGLWTPYVVTVHEEGGAGFTGDVYLVPNNSRTPPNAFPSYRAPITLAKGGQRTTTFYVIDGPDGYYAELRDPSGRVVARAQPSGSPGSRTAFGILSDLPQAEQKISAPLRALSRLDTALVRFSSPQDFPNSAAYLSGLSGLIIDQFDSGALSQTQVQALKDFVGLGGSLVVAGGSFWRQTLHPLPPELLPMPPSSTSTASLAPLAELGAKTTEATAQVAGGGNTSGVVVLRAPDGQPLVVEGIYGAGRVIELTFDPFAQPFDTQVDLAGLVWGQAISRALSSVQGGASPPPSRGFGAAYNPNSNLAAGPGSWAPGFGGSRDQISNILQDTPAATAPPVGLLGGLLVAYVLLAGFLNYLFVKTLGRRVLMWVSIPAIALVFTAGSYAVGFGSRGSDFLITEVQVQRLGPEGAVESYSFDGVYPPRKGDVSLTLQGGTLVSTAVAQGALGDTRGGAVITMGAKPQALLGGVAVWTMRPVQTLLVTHLYHYEPKQSMPIDVQVRLTKGHLVGRVVNLTSHPVNDLELVSGAGTQGTLARTLAPGATATVDVDISSGSTSTPGTGQTGAGARPTPIPGVSANSRDAMIRLAQTQALSGRAGEFAVIGFTRAIDSIRVDGAPPSRASVAALVEPVRLQSADSLSGVAPHARLVSNYTGDASDHVNVYDFDLPSGVTTPIGLNYQMPDVTQPAVRSVEVYDWNRHSWRALPKQLIPSRVAGPVPLSAGELAGGVVRVRVHEAQPYGASLALTDGQNGP